MTSLESSKLDVWKKASVLINELQKYVENRLLVHQQNAQNSKGHVEGKKRRNTFLLENMCLFLKEKSRHVYQKRLDRIVDRMIESLDCMSGIVQQYETRYFGIANKKSIFYGQVRTFYYRLLDMVGIDSHANSIFEGYSSLFSKLCEKDNFTHEDLIVEKLCELIEPLQTEDDTENLPIYVVASFQAFIISVIHVFWKLRRSPPVEMKDIIKLRLRFIDFIHVFSGYLLEIYESRELSFLNHSQLQSIFDQTMWRPFGNILPFCGSSQHFHRFPTIISLTKGNINWHFPFCPIDLQDKKNILKQIHKILNIEETKLENVVSSLNNLPYLPLHKTVDASQFFEIGDDMKNSNDFLVNDATRDDTERKSLRFFVNQNFNLQGIEKNAFIGSRKELKISLKKIIAHDIAPEIFKDDSLESYSSDKLVSDILNEMLSEKMHSQKSTRTNIFEQHPLIRLSESIHSLTEFLSNNAESKETDSNRGANTSSNHESNLEELIIRIVNSIVDAIFHSKFSLMDIGRENSRNVCPLDSEMIDKFVNIMGIDGKYLYSTKDTYVPNPNHPFFNQISRDIRMKSNLPLSYIQKQYSDIDPNLIQPYVLMEKQGQINIENNSNDQIGITEITRKKLSFHKIHSAARGMWNNIMERTMKNSLELLSVSEEENEFKGIVNRISTLFDGDNDAEKMAMCSEDANSFDDIREVLMFQLEIIWKDWIFQTKETSEKPQPENLMNKERLDTFVRNWITTSKDSDLLFMPIDQNGKPSKQEKRVKDITVISEEPQTIQTNLEKNIRYHREENNLEGDDPLITLFTTKLYEKKSNDKKLNIGQANSSYFPLYEYIYDDDKDSEDLRNPENMKIFLGETVPKLKEIFGVLKKLKTQNETTIKLQTSEREKLIKGIRERFDSTVGHTFDLLKASKDSDQRVLTVNSDEREEVSKLILLASSIMRSKTSKTKRRYRKGLIYKIKRFCNLHLSFFLTRNEKEIWLKRKILTHKEPATYNFHNMETNRRLYTLIQKITDSLQDYSSNFISKLKPTLSLRYLYILIWMNDNYVGHGVKLLEVLANIFPERIIELLDCVLTHIIYKLSDTSSSLQESNIEQISLNSLDIKPEELKKLLQPLQDFIPRILDVIGKHFPSLHLEQQTQYFTEYFHLCILLSHLDHGEIKNAIISVLRILTNTISLTLPDMKEVFKSSIIHFGRLSSLDKDHKYLKLYVSTLNDLLHLWMKNVRYQENIALMDHIFCNYFKSIDIMEHRFDMKLPFLHAIYWDSCQKMLLPPLDLQHSLESDLHHILDFHLIHLLLIIYALLYIRNFSEFSLHLLELLFIASQRIILLFSICHEQWIRSSNLYEHPELLISQVKMWLLRRAHAKGLRGRFSGRLFETIAEVFNVILRNNHRNRISAGITFDQIQSICFMMMVSMKSYPLDLLIFSIEKWQRIAMLFYIWIPEFHAYSILKTNHASEFANIPHYLHASYQYNGGTSIDKILKPITYCLNPVKDILSNQRGAILPRLPSKLIIGAYTTKIQLQVSFLAHRIKENIDKLFIDQIELSDHKKKESFYCIVELCLLDVTKLLLMNLLLQGTQVNAMQNTSLSSLTSLYVILQRLYNHKKKEGPLFPKRYLIGYFDVMLSNEELDWLKKNRKIASFLQKKLEDYTVKYKNNRRIEKNSDLGNLITSNFDESRKGGENDLMELFYQTDCVQSKTFHVASFCIMFKSTLHALHRVSSRISSTFETSVIQNSLSNIWNQSMRLQEETYTSDDIELCKAFQLFHFHKTVRLLNAIKCGGNENQLRTLLCDAREELSNWHSDIEYFKTNNELFGSFFLTRINILEQKCMYSSVQNQESRTESDVVAEILNYMKLRKRLEDSIENSSSKENIFNNLVLSLLKGSISNTLNELIVMRKKKTVEEFDQKEYSFQEPTQLDVIYEYVKLKYLWLKYSYFLLPSNHEKLKEMLHLMLESRNIKCDRLVILSNLINRLDLFGFHKSYLPIEMVHICCVQRTLDRKKFFPLKYFPALLEYANLYLIGKNTTHSGIKIIEDCIKHFWSNYYSIHPDVVPVFILFKNHEKYMKILCAIVQKSKQLNEEDFTIFLNIQNISKILIPDNSEEMDLDRRVILKMEKMDDKKEFLRMWSFLTDCSLLWPEFLKEIVIGSLDKSHKQRDADSSGENKNVEWKLPESFDQNRSKYIDVLQNGMKLFEDENKVRNTVKRCEEFTKMTFGFSISSQFFGLSRNKKHFKSWICKMVKITKMFDSMWQIFQLKLLSEVYQKETSELFSIITSSVRPENDTVKILIFDICQSGRYKELMKEMHSANDLGEQKMTLCTKYLYLKHLKNLSGHFKFNKSSIGTTKLFAKLIKKTFPKTYDLLSNYVSPEQKTDLDSIEHEFLSWKNWNNLSNIVELSPQYDSLATEMEIINQIRSISTSSMKTYENYKSMKSVVWSIEIMKFYSRYGKEKRELLRSMKYILRKGKSLEETILEALSKEKSKIPMSSLQYTAEEMIHHLFKLSDGYIMDVQNKARKFPYEIFSEKIRNDLHEIDSEKLSYPNTIIFHFPDLVSDLLQGIRTTWNRFPSPLFLVSSCEVKQEYIGNFEIEKEAAITMNRILQEQEIFKQNPKGLREEIENKKTILVTGKTITSSYVLHVVKVLLSHYFYFHQAISSQQSEDLLQIMRMMYQVSLYTSSCTTKMDGHYGLSISVEMAKFLIQCAIKRYSLTMMNDENQQFPGHGKDSHFSYLVLTLLSLAKVAGAIILKMTSIGISNIQSLDSKEQHVHIGIYQSRPYKQMIRMYLYIIGLILLLLNNNGEKSFVPSPLAEESESDDYSFQSLRMWICEQYHLSLSVQNARIKYFTYFAELERIIIDSYSISMHVAVLESLNGITHYLSRDFCLTSVSLHVLAQTTDTSPQMRLRSLRRISFILLHRIFIQNAGLDQIKQHKSDILHLLDYYCDSFILLSHSLLGLGELPSILKLIRKVKVSYLQNGLDALGILQNFVIPLFSDLNSLVFPTLIAL